jgi:hypothetical protein
VTDQAEPGRQPAHDLAAFDVSKRSPEQIAEAFARWKEQRKRPRQGAEPARASRLPLPRPVSAVERGAAQDSLAVSEEKSRAIRYSTPFAALLAAGSEPTVAHRIWYPDLRLPSLRRRPPTGRRPKATWLLTGAAAIVAVAAMAGGALLEQRGPVEAKSSAAQVHPPDIPFVVPTAAARGADRKLQQAIDFALMKAAPPMGAVHPPAPVVRTASKAAAAPKSAPAALQFVPKPFVPSVAPAAAISPVVPAVAAGLSGDPRPDALVQRGHDQGKNAYGSGNRATSSGGKPAGAAGSGGSADPRSASSRSNGAAATGGASDPASGAASGDGEGDESGAGGDTGGGADSGGDTDSGDTGGSDTGGSDSGGGDAGGDSDGGDSGGTGGGDTSDGDAGGDDSGDGDSGGGSGGEDGESGGVGGALGGVGNALGGALDGGKDNNSADGETKDKDKSD